MTRSDSSVDVVILGAGPAGLVAALWMAKYGIKARLVEQRPYRLRVGGADGIHPRSMEMFESFGIDREITQAWEPITGWALWCRDAKGNLGRSDRLDNPTPLRCRWGPGVLQQGIIERIIKNELSRYQNVEIEYETTPTSLEVRDISLNDPDAYPCVLTLRRDANTHAPEEIIRSKYVIGADGARSWTRKQLGFSMEGTRTRSVWAVADLVVVSDFPDFGETGLFFIRRERGLTRFYVQLNRNDEDEFPSELISQELIVQRLQQLFKPYTITVKSCEWWSSYTVAHYLSNGIAQHSRVFLVGDAVHNHSPLVGLGMNISMQDSYNLGWKLAGVVRKELHPRVLSTYETERRPVAEELIATDQFHLQFFDTVTVTGSEPAWMQKRELELQPFTQGFSVHYNDPLLSAGTRTTLLTAEVVASGERFPQLNMINHATGKPYPIQSLLKSDGRFHVVIFAGDISKPQELSEFNILGTTLRIIERQILPASMNGFNVIAIHQADKTTVELASLAEIYFPASETTGRDYERVFCEIDANYDELGIGKRGAVVIVRPDQYVGWRGELSDIEGLTNYLRPIFAPKRKFT
ncbi:FAD binding domain protein [Xylogone sp. PMI_703]|nr:FAD binding domain protein [Xylogone sp. PMI_703]